MPETILIEIVPSADGWRVLRQGVEIARALPSREAALERLEHVRRERGVVIEFRIYDTNGAVETAWCSFSPRPDPEWGPGGPSE